MQPQYLGNKSAEVSQRLQDDNLLRQVTMQSMENNLYLDVRQSVWKVHRLPDLVSVFDFQMIFPPKVGEHFVKTQHLKMASSEPCQAASSIIGPLYLDHLFLSTPKCAWKHGSRFHWWCDRFHETCNPHKTHKSTHKYVMQQTVQNSFQSYHVILWSIHFSNVKDIKQRFFGHLWFSLRKGASKETPKLGIESTALWNWRLVEKTMCWVDKNMIRMMIDI